MKKFIVPVLIVVAIAVFFVIGRKEKAIETVKPSYEAAVQAVYATGTVEAVRMIPIAPKVNARLMQLMVDEGQTVEKGQVLAQLEDSDINRTLEELQARLDLAEKALGRTQTLAKSGAISKSALDQAVAEQKTAQAAVERTQAELSYLLLVAPEDGMIIRRDGEIGELLTPSSTAFWMTGGSEFRIETEVDEEDISLVKPGQEVLISADAFPQKIFKGNVQSITPKGDPVARSYRVRVSLESGTPLLIGMTAETNIMTQEKDRALMVPATSVKGNEIWILKDGKPVKTSITKGIVTDDKIEILSGVSEGDDVAVHYSDVAPEKEAEKAACNMATGC